MLSVFMNWTHPEQTKTLWNFRVITSFIDFVAKRIKFSRISILGLEISLDEDYGSVDERLKKIEIAKQNLLEGLTAIDELKKEAENNKKEVEAALTKLAELQANKSNLQEEVENLQTVISSDVTAFQKLAKVPSDKQIRNERIIGFISGVLASVLASGIVWIIVILYNKIFPSAT